MKTIYSLKEFHAKAVEVSGIEANLVAVSVEAGIHHQMEFKCYAHDYNWYHGKTMEEALDQLYNATHPLATIEPNIDVEIDIVPEEDKIEKAVKEIQEVNLSDLPF